MSSISGRPLSEQLSKFIDKTDTLLKMQVEIEISQSPSADLIRQYKTEMLTFVRLAGNLRDKGIEAVEGLKE